VKGGGRGTGAAFVGWNGTYSFNFEARNIAVETLTATSQSTLPLSGLIDVTAGGSGRFEKPQYEARLTVRDFFVADSATTDTLASLPSGKFSTVGIMLKCFQKAGVDVSKVDGVLAVQSAGKLDFALSQVKLGTVADKTQTCN
jgi:hypothetical protein